MNLQNNSIIRNMLVEIHENSIFKKSFRAIKWLITPSKKLNISDILRIRMDIFPTNWVAYCEHKNGKGKWVFTDGPDHNWFRYYPDETSIIQVKNDFKL